MTHTAKQHISTEFYRWRPLVAAVGWKFLLPILLLTSFVGCGSNSSSPQVEPLPQRPLRAMDSALRRGQLQEAWELADAVLEKHPRDAETIAKVARIAHDIGKPDVAAELLVKSCRAESFNNAVRVQQAMIAMIGVGRLHEGMEMLEEALQKQPLQDETRRWLFDFYMGTENRSAGVPHGRFLVQQRKFDLELLQSLSNTERRTQENTTLEEMTSRNPDDMRPLLGGAKNKFDLGEYDSSIEMLRSIVQTHQDYLPAQAMLGRALAASGQYDELEKWAAVQSESIEAYSGYWLALGDWARSKGQPSAAARAYWEATQRDADVMEAWSKLNTTLQQLQAVGTKFPPEMLASIENRATQLSKFNQLKQRFERTGSISRAIAVDIVNVLHDLGRLWEAEAWASLALTLPEDDAVPTQQVRDSIVKLLSKETPWQVTEQHPEFLVDLTNLDMPAISAIADSPRPRSTPADSKRVEVTNLSLLNEATSRGLTYFGRTADDLDQPGIMLYETLGCGGGTIDFDLDGWSDLYLVSAGGTPPNRDSAANALMRNLAGKFSEVTTNSGSGDTSFGQGVAVGDVNEDGFPDLLVLNYGPNVLLVNNGDGTFTEASDRLGENGNDWSTSAAIADLDGDGISDLVIVNYCAGLDPVTTTCPMKDSDVFRSCTPMQFPGQSDFFLQGTPQGKFVDRTEDWNAKPTVVGRGLGIVAGSLDDSPGVDVFVANDMTNNHFWSRSPEYASFRLNESGMLRGLGCDDRSLAQGSMGIATGDFDGDGDVDLYVTNFDNEYNTYHEQRGAGIWQDVTSRVQLSMPTMALVGFGSEAIDMDNDGSLELVVSNGHVDMFSRADEKSVYAHPMQVFRRNASQTFDSIGESLAGEYLSSPHVGRALWTIDANRDSLTDLAVTHQTEPVALLINHSKPSGDWIDIDLRGRACSRDAIGATVEVTVGEKRWSAIQTSGDGYLCSNQRTLRFGLGDAVGKCQVQVTWPDETSQIYRDLESNTSWLLLQSDAQAFHQD